MATFTTEDETYNNDNDNNSKNENISSILPTLGKFEDLNLIKIIERWSSLPDLPLEDATDIEKEKVEILRANVLKAQGLKEPPKGTWKNHHYRKGQMLCYLRARGGDVDLATKRALECIDFLNTVFEKAKEYEGYPQSKKDLFNQSEPQGIFGKDKRGASVLYYKYGNSDRGSVVQRVGWDFFSCWDWRFALYYWDTLFQDGIENGVFLQGRTWVMDCEGISYARIIRGRWLAPKQTGKFPGGEHPMPEGIKHCFVRNTPWIVQKVYNWLKRFLPERTQRKVRFFSKSDDEKYLEALLKEVDSDQIPVCFGGTSKIKWPYSNGPDLGNVTEDEHEKINVSTIETVENIVQPNSTCLVEIKIVSKDINISIEALNVNSGSKEIIVEDVKITSVEGWRSFRCQIPKEIKKENFVPGEQSFKLMVTFDNSFSWLYGKTVLYRFVLLEEEVLEEEDSQNN